MAGSNVNIAPERSEIEVSLFGPGYGESIVLHLGENLWLIVDSCLDPLTGDPAPLTYLHHLHIDLATAVRWVVATHWHDDHIRGLGRIMHVCKAAEFVCSAALKHKQRPRVRTSAMGETRTYVLNLVGTQKAAPEKVRLRF